MNIAVFCSGSGTNLQAIIDARKRGDLTADISLVVSDTPDCFALKRAERSGIKRLVVERKNYATRAEFENAIVKELKKEKLPEYFEDRGWSIYDAKPTTIFRDHVDGPVQVMCIVKPLSSL